MTEFIVKVGEVNGAILEEVPAKNLAFSYILNSSGAISFTLPLRHPKSTPSLLTPATRELLLYREGELIWGGYLWTIQADATEVRVGGEGWFSRLERRYIDVTQTFTNREQFDIAWELIDFTQTKDFGDLGFTRESVPLSGVTRTRTYNAWERKPIAETITQLAAVNRGFDFDFTPDKRFEAYYPNKGTSEASLVFEMPKNIVGLSQFVDGTGTYSEVTSVGSGTEAATLLSVAQDTDAISEFGLLQTSTAYTDVKVQATLDAHAMADVARLKVVQNDPQLQVITNDPPWGAYSVGDTVRVVVNDGFIQIDKAFRITTITVSVSDEGREAVGLFFDEVLP